MRMLEFGSPRPVIGWGSKWCKRPQPCSKCTGHAERIDTPMWVLMRLVQSNVGGPYNSVGSLGLPSVGVSTPGPTSRLASEKKRLGVLELAHSVMNNHHLRAARTSQSSASFCSSRIMHAVSLALRTMARVDECVVEIGGRAE